MSENKANMNSVMESNTKGTNQQKPKTDLIEKKKITNSIELTPSKEIPQQIKAKDDSSQKKRKNDFKDSNRAVKKPERLPTKDDYEIRFLIKSKDAGALIGKQGSNITFLRQHFDSSVVVTDCQGPERVLSFTVHQSQVEQILASVIGYLEENNQKPSIELRLLVHTNFVGSIIGKQGSKLKEIRQKHNISTIKIFPQCCPKSSERVCVVQGKPENVITCIRNILDIVYSHQPSGKIFFYNPANYIPNSELQYGGYPPEPSIKRGTRDFNNVPRNNINNSSNRLQQRGPNQRLTNRRFNQNKNVYNQHDAWNRNQSSYYNNDWSQTSNQMNYHLHNQSQLNSLNNSYQNNYQQNNYQQTNYQDNSYQQSSYQTSHQPYYVDSQYSSNNQMYGKQDVMINSNEYANQINQMNNNSMNSNQLNSFWNSSSSWNNFYNNGNQGGSANLSNILTVPTNNEH